MRITHMLMLVSAVLALGMIVQLVDMFAAWRENESGVRPPDLRHRLTLLLSISQRIVSLVVAVVVFGILLQGHIPPAWLFVLPVLLAIFSSVIEMIVDLKTPIPGVTPELVKLSRLGDSMAQNAEIDSDIERLFRPDLTEAEKQEAEYRLRQSYIVSAVRFRRLRLWSNARDLMFWGALMAGLMWYLLVP